MARPLSCVDCGIEFIGHGSRRYCDSCRAARAYQPKPRVTDVCIVCSVSILHRYPTAKYCESCADRQIPINARTRTPQNDNETARRLTKYAVKIGFLPPPTDFDCVDCKHRQAECYDHRDYTQPLSVDPVCLRCNSSRGAGKPLHLNHLNNCAENAA